MNELTPIGDVAISHYRIIKRLGAGGMGEVYLAEDTKLDRKVAIKLLPQATTGDEKAKSRLIREARAAARLDHPNICAVHEVGEEEGRSFIVLELSPAKQARLTKRYTLNPEAYNYYAKALYHFENIRPGLKALFNDVRFNRAALMED
jgi:serine/threonine protein kinase